MERERSYQIPRDKPADLLEGNSSQLLIPERKDLIFFWRERRWKERGGMRRS